MIRAVVIEADPLIAEQLSTLLSDSGEVEVIGVATDTATGLKVCGTLWPDAVFLDINLSLADCDAQPEQFPVVVQPPRLVFTATDADFAAQAFRLEAIDYLLKPLNPLQVVGAVRRLLAQIKPAAFAFPFGLPGNRLEGLSAETVTGKDLAPERLPVAEMDRDQIRLLARHEIVAVRRLGRRTWVHTVLEEFATSYPLAQLASWLGGFPFVQIGRHAIVNLRAIDEVSPSGPRLYCLRLRDRLGTEVTTTRTGAALLDATLNDPRSTLKGSPLPTAAS